jgi:AcrR family transcriptional regulator
MLCMQSPPLRKYDRSEPTRLKILQAAGALFAARGFHGVGMRDIAAEAGVSLRMANYHFGAKSGLFAVCTRLALDEGVRLPALFAVPPEFPDRRVAWRGVLEKAEACFRAFHAPDREEWHGGIVFRAMIEGSEEAFEAFWEGLQLSRQWFFAALPQACPGLTDAQISAWHATLWAQIAFYVGAKRALLRAADRTSYDEAAIAAACGHLQQTLAGLLKAPPALSS